MNYKEILGQFLTREELGGEPIDDPIEFLTDKFGKPEEVVLEDGAKQLAFAVSSGSLLVTIIAGAAAWFGLQLKKQAAPCASPGYAGKVSGVGSATATYRGLGALAAFYGTIFGFPNGTLLLQATSNAFTNLSKLKAFLCPKLCPPPCRCDTDFLLPPPPTITKVGTRWNVTVTVTVTLSEKITCV
ncbi:MAG: hypothetical protein OEM82_11210 [Acidobacteriota bacterium]|nr:hypothetical protein [Acidobacteriota bacterium]